MAFLAVRSTVGLSVTNASLASPIELPTAGTPSARVTNAGTNASIFISFGTTAANAIAAAVIPTAGNAKMCVHLLPMETMIVVVPAGSTHVGYIGSDAGPTLAYLTTGTDNY